MVRFLIALVPILALTGLPVQASPLAQPRQPVPVRIVQSSTGTLFLTQDASAWPLVADQITDDEDLTGLTLRSQINVLPVDPLERPQPRQRVVQAADGGLYDIVEGDAGGMDGVWPLVPDQISDDDLAALSIAVEIDGTIPPGLGSDMSLAAPAPVPVAAMPLASPTPISQRTPVSVESNQAPCNIFPGTPIANQPINCTVLKPGQAVTSTIDSGMKPSPFFSNSLSQQYGIALDRNKRYRVEFTTADAPNGFRGLTDRAYHLSVLFFGPTKESINSGSVTNEVWFDVIGFAPNGTACDAPPHRLHPSKGDNNCAFTPLADGVYNIFVVIHYGDPIVPPPQYTLTVNVAS